MDFPKADPEMRTLAQELYWRGDDRKRDPEWRNGTEKEGKPNKGM